jgi:Tfp pilus assembly protein PilZ
MPTKNDIKKIVSTALEGVASTIFINHTLAIIEESADSKASFMAAADRIRNRVALFIDESLAGKLFAILHAEIGKMEMTPGTRRKHVRVGFRNKVNLTHGGRVYELYTTNISEGGMNVEIKEPFPVGAHVEISLPLKGGNSIAIDGVVVNIKSCRGLQPAGMGIQFNGVSDLITTILKSIINRASDREGAASPRTRHLFAGRSDARQ